MLTRLARLTTAPALLCFVFGCGTNVANYPGSGANTDPKLISADLALMAGTWEYARLAEDGKEVPVSGLGESHIVISEDTMTQEMYSADGKHVNTIKSKIWIDPTYTPKLLDLDQTGSFGKSRKPGIYQLNGDILTLCWEKTGNVRPEQFDSPNKSTKVSRRTGED